MCGICANNSKLAKCNSKFTVTVLPTGQFSLQEQAMPVSSVSETFVSEVHSATLRDQQPVHAGVCGVMCVRKKYKKDQKVGIHWPEKATS